MLMGHELGTPLGTTDARIYKHNANVLLPFSIYILNLISIVSSAPISGLNKDFDLPNSFAVQCNAPPSMFAYPKVEEKKEDEKKTVATAVLSTTARAKAREARKEVTH
jgi:hypothetical protein